LHRISAISDCSLYLFTKTMVEAVEIEERPKFRDIRRYFCQYCGICRSKKTLITSHINSHHKVPFVSLFFVFSSAKLNPSQSSLFKLLQLGYKTLLILVCFFRKRMRRQEKKEILKKSLRNPTPARTVASLSRNTHICCSTCKVIRLRYLHVFKLLTLFTFLNTRQVLDVKL